MRATSMYDLSLGECADLICASGHLVTYLLQGHIGVGKSALLGTLGAKMPTHRPVYFDCTTKDLGDLLLPNLQDASGDHGFVRFVPNEELGLHLGGPIILMLDELGKANPSVQNAVMRVMYERKLGNYTLHPDSIVFATTNLGGEGVGDLLKAHQYNRVTVITVRKPDYMEWLEWGINNGIDHSVLGWVRDNPQLFQTFEEVTDPEQNPYIFHPKDPSRKSFVSGRSLEKASNIIKAASGRVGDNVLTSALIGTIGARAAMDLMSFVTLAHDMPTHISVKETPETAKIPTAAAAVCMVVYRALATLEPDWIDNWMIYLNRLSPEAQGLFANGVRVRGYGKQSMVMLNASFTNWIARCSYMFGTDKT